MRILFLVILIALFTGCDREEKETTTKGNLHLFIPASIAPVMIDEVNEFMNLYSPNGARITYTIVSSKIAVNHFVQDTARIVFIPRQLTQAEKDQAKKNSDNLNELVIAYDGIVAVVNPQNKIEQITTTEIYKILSGAITRWDQLATAMPVKGDIKIYCQDSSDVTEYLIQRLLKQSKISSKLIHTISDLQTLQSVEKEPLSIGFAALGWIDSVKPAVKVLNLGRTKEDTDTTNSSPAETIGSFYSPHPANIFRNYYPLKRAIYMYTRTQLDLAAGFGTYAATAEGQKLFLKRGLLPGTQRIKLKSN